MAKSLPPTQLNRVFSLKRNFDSRFGMPVRLPSDRTRSFSRTARNDVNLSRFADTTFERMMPPSSVDHSLAPDKSEIADTRPPSSII